MGNNGAKKSHFRTMKFFCCQMKSVRSSCIHQSASLCVQIFVLSLNISNSNNPRNRISPVHDNKFHNGNPWLCTRAVPEMEFFLAKNRQFLVVIFTAGLPISYTLGPRLEVVVTA